jgi:hypothetical protein
MPRLTVLSGKFLAFFWTIRRTVLSTSYHLIPPYPIAPSYVIPPSSMLSYPVVLYPLDWIGYFSVRHRFVGLINFHIHPPSLLLIILTALLGPHGPCSSTPSLLRPDSSKAGASTSFAFFFWGPVPQTPRGSLRSGLPYAFYLWSQPPRPPVARSARAFVRANECPDVRPKCYPGRFSQRKGSFEGPSGASHGGLGGLAPQEKDDGRIIGCSNI